MQKSMGLAKEIFQYNDETAIINKLTKANNNMAQRFFTPYLTTRRKYNKQLDNALLTTLTNGKKDVTFETTGGSGLDWLCDLHQDTYNVHLLFPLVEVEEGWKRYVSRAVNMYQKGNYFRFGTTWAKYKQMYNTSYQNFINIIDRIDHPSKGSDSCHRYQTVVVVYQNTQIVLVKNGKRTRKFNVGKAFVQRFLQQ